MDICDWEVQINMKYTLKILLLISIKGCGFNNIAIEEAKSVNACVKSRDSSMRNDIEITVY